MARAVEIGATIMPLRLLQWLAGLLLGLKLLMLLTSGAFMDETYYWMWGQHPGLSYFDHPPLNAWLLGLSATVFGWTHLALRLPVIAVLFADIYVLWLFARRLAPHNAEAYFWLTLVLFLSIPVFELVSAAALPDHVLVLTVLAALYGFCGFFLGQDRGEAGYGQLYLGAVFLGLAGLAKYNAALLGLALVVYVIMTPRYRGLLRQPQLYLAGAITLALQAPVLAWNIEQHFASYDFILVGRHAGLAASLDGIIPYLLAMVLFLSPFLWVIIARLLVSQSNVVGSGLARTAFMVSTLSLLVVSGFTATLFHWNLVAYCAVLPFLAAHIRWRWEVIGQVLYGAVVLVGILINYSIVPLADVQRFGDEASAWSFGWNKTALAVADMAATYHAGFIATPDYTTASLLGFAMRNPDVTSLSSKTDQYDFWFDGTAHLGQSAIIFDDDWRPLPASVRGQFSTLTLLKELEVGRLGKVLDHHRVYLGTGYMPNG